MLRFRRAVHSAVDRPLTSYFARNAKSLRALTRYAYTTVENTVADGEQKGLKKGGEASQTHPRQPAQPTERTPYTIDNDIRRALRHALATWKGSDGHVGPHLTGLLSQMHAVFSASDMKSPVKLRVKQTIMEILSHEGTPLNSFCRILGLVKKGHTAGISPKLMPILKNVEWCQETLPLPKPDDYATLDWMRPSVLENQIRQAVERNKLTMHASATYAEKEELTIPRQRLGLKPIHVCIIVVEIGDSFSETVFGEGYTKKEANCAAWLVLVSKLHTSELLGQLFYRPLKGQHVGDEDDQAKPPETITNQLPVKRARRTERNSRLWRERRERIGIRLQNPTRSGAPPGPSSPLTVVDLPISLASLRFMQEGLTKAKLAGLPNKRTVLEAEEQIIRMQRWARKPLGLNAQARVSQELLEKQHEFERNEGMAGLLRQKASLPIRTYGQRLLDMVSENQYSIVVGATGSGKTTQVPQIILEQAIAMGEGAACNIICTQPRRIAAVSVGQRVAVERNEELGESVGYSVRFDSKRPRLGGSITYCTTGSLLEQLKYTADSTFDTTSHIVIDEVHERNRDTDFLLVVLKKALAERRAQGKNIPKVVIMSATLNTELFQQYFAEQVAGGSAEQCPFIDVPGRTFPVEETYLDSIVNRLRDKYNAGFRKLLNKDRDGDMYLSSEANFVEAAEQFGLTPDDLANLDAKRLNQWNASDEENTAIVEREEGLIAPSLVAATIADICSSTTDGALLAFLPGTGEIADVEKMLRDPTGVFGIDFNNTDKFKIHILHSMVPKEQQNEVFLALPSGTRRIILSTNVAETSITVPDLKYVVDSGKQRELRYDHARRITRLKTCWISRSNVKQRAGRAGRVQNGYYYGLFSRERLQSMPAAGVAEILRTDLQDTCLSIKAHGLKEDVGDFLSAAIEPPDPEAIQAAVNNLKDIEAFTEDESITALGQVLSRLRLLPSLGKMVLLGIIFRCLDSMIILGACMQEPDLLYTPISSRKKARAAHKKYATDKSDQFAALTVFKELRRIKLEQGLLAAEQHAYDNFLHFETFKRVESIAESVLGVLVERGLVPPSPMQPEMQLPQLGDSTLNRNSDNKTLISALLLAGFNSNIAVKAAGRRLLYHAELEQLVKIKAASWNGGAYLPQGTMLIYRSMRRRLRGYQLLIEGITPVDPLTGVLFGGSLQLGNYNRVVKDGWLPFVVKEPGGPDSWHYVRDGRIVTSAMILVEFRDCLDGMLNDAFRSLASLQRAASEGQEQEHEDKNKGGLQYFADNPAHELLAQTVVKLLDENSRSTASRTELFESEWPSADMLIENEQEFDDANII